MKKILLTGASSGIGLATAKTLSENGYEVWGTSRELGRVPQLPRLHPVELDLSSQSSIDQGFNAALGEAGSFDVMINNAGSGHFGPAEFLPAETLADQFQILLFGHVHLMQLALAQMRRQKQGLIINLTSLASRLPLPFMA